MVLVARGRHVLIEVRTFTLLPLRTFESIARHVRNATFIVFSVNILVEKMVDRVIVFRAGYILYGNRGIQAHPLVLHTTVAVEGWLTISPKEVINTLFVKNRLILRFRATIMPYLYADVTYLLDILEHKSFNFWVLMLVSHIICTAFRFILSSVL